MEQKQTLKTLQLLILLPLYYIVGEKSLFLYALSLSLYKIYISCFSHITIKDKINNKLTNKKIYTTILLILSTICIAFLLLGIIISDIINNLLNINNTFLVFLMMGFSIITEPFIKITTEYIEVVKSKKISKSLFNLYYVLESILLLIISILFFRIFNIKEYIAVSLLYLAKIISALLITTISYILLKKNKNNNQTDNINYKKIIKEVFVKNHHQSIVKIVKNSYYYISIIIVYLILNTRYGYANQNIENILVFIYFYFLEVINYIIELITTIIKNKSKTKNIINKIYKIFETMLTLAIIIGITSPLICKLLFNQKEVSIYLMMISFLAIFISLYNITSENIKNKKVIYISLSSGLIAKIILIIPLINSFYRIGYNLIYGDIISTIIGMFITTIINFIYIRNKHPEKEITPEVILKTLYENILLCIILTICQFIIPINTDNYFKALLLIILYLLVSIMFIKIKNKKRG